MERGKEGSTLTKITIKHMEVIISRYMTKANKFNSSWTKPQLMEVPVGQPVIGVNHFEFDFEFFGTNGNINSTRGLWMGFREKQEPSGNRVSNGAHARRSQHMESRLVGEGRLVTSAIHGELSWICDSWIPRRSARPFKFRFIGVAGIGRITFLLVLLTTCRRNAKVEEVILRRGKLSLLLMRLSMVSSQILARLPVKSIVRFKCVCKTWRTLFSSPQFIAMHFRKTSENPANHSLIIHGMDEEFYHNMSLLNVNSTEKEPVCVVNPSPVVLYQMDLVGSVNGMVCLACPPAGNTIVLWNPAMNLWKEIQLSKMFRHIQCSKDGVILAETPKGTLFSYDPETNGIKEYSVSGAQKASFEAFSYIESLVRIEGMELVKEQDRDVLLQRYKHLQLLQRCNHH
ncbi:OLC1v1022161C1 [Oldenlandia corymbosa var. corymbosa]|uniref:OLC1v1022161C1 n=1 Tax=Oldenlandia corymbosa var. corymbosa TaxID=529605 RepID=A0AAV1BYX7_OLDCO|nr:OLC1v1022161C1 [Oldenlandia corymbosa var. corymbosa]